MFNANLVSTVKTKIKSYLPALVVLVAVQWLLEAQTALLKDWVSFINWSAYGVLIIVAGVAMHFNRAVYSHIAVILAIQFFMIQSLLQVPLAEMSAQVTFIFLAVWLPLAVLTVVLMPYKPAYHGFQLFTAALYLIPLGVFYWQLESLGQAYQSFLATTDLSVETTAFWPVVWLVTPYWLFSLSLVMGIVLMILDAFTGKAALGFLLVVVQTLMLARFSVDYQSTLMTFVAGLFALYFLLKQSWQLVYLDELTGLPGRRAMNETMQGLGRKYALAMMDVDHFKKFNDTYGHDIGDQVLKMVAARISEVTGGGKPFRYGGEEFSIIFPGCSIDQVLPHLEAVRSAIENYKMTIRDEDRPKDNTEGQKQRTKSSSKSSGSASEQVSVTISIGVAERTPETKDANAVLKFADNALYRAKEAGRNQVCT